MQRLDHTYYSFRRTLMANVSHEEPVWLGLGLAIVPIVTIVGNTLVVMAILFDKHLRTTTNTLLLSLALADLLVGVVVMPPSIYLVVNNLRWFLSPILCTVFTISDVTASTASIVHLTAISADRFFAVLRHIEYATPQHRKRVRIFIVCTWIVSILIGLPLVLILDPNRHINASICGIEDYNFMLYGSIFSFYIPAGAMLIMYGLIFSKLHRRLKTVRFQEDTAARVVQFTQTMMPGAGEVTSSYRKGRKNWELSWAKPFVQSLEDKVKTPGAECVSRKDLRELTVILAKLESHEFSVHEMEDGGDSHYMELSKNSENNSSQTHYKSSIPSVNGDHSVYTGDTITWLLGPRIALLCGADKISKRLAARKLQLMRARAYRLLMKLKSKQGMAIRKENRATKLVATVMIVFLICWLPFFTMNLAKVYFLRHDYLAWPQDAEIVFIIFTWFGYCNSAVNPIIYGMINRNFRTAFIRLLTCQWLQSRRRSKRSLLREQISKARRRSSKLMASWFVSRKETYCRETYAGIQLPDNLGPITEIPDSPHNNTETRGGTVRKFEESTDHNSNAGYVQDDAISVHDSDTFL